MPKFELISTKRDMTLGVIECESIEVAELFLAMNFPDDFFGANIKGLDTNSFIFVAVKEAYGPDATPLSAALNSLDSRIKIKNELCHVTDDGDGILRSPYKTLDSVDGMLVEGKMAPTKATRDALAELDTMLKNFGYWSDSSLYISVKKCIQNAMIGHECVPKANVKSDLERILSNFGFYSKASLWISIMNFVDRMYS